MIKPNDMELNTKTIAFIAAIVVASVLLIMGEEKLAAGSLFLIYGIYERFERAQTENYFKKRAPHTYQRFKEKK
jgi:hypothetical protein